MEWNEYFMRMVYLVASKSKDKSTKVGAVIVNPESKQVLATGYNGFCRGLDDNNLKRSVSPEKYFWTCHAEANSVFSAARQGIKLNGSVIYTNLIPCSDCAKAIIQSGIKKVVVHKQPMSMMEQKFKDSWGKSFEVSQTMLEELKIPLEKLDLKLETSCLIGGKKVFV